MRAPHRQARQLGFDTLLPTPGSGASFNDPAFIGNKTLPIHRWVPWIAGFSSAFVQDALSRYLTDRGVVLDPFAGVGTTLVEALLAGHKAVGFEINPYAALVSRTKLQAHHIDLDRFRIEIQQFQRFCDTTLAAGTMPQSKPPEGFSTRAPFYSSAVLHKVLLVQDFIRTLEEATLQDLFRLAFAATMVRYSNYSYEPSLGQRVSAGKAPIEDYPVGQEILLKLQEMLSDAEWFAQQIPLGRRAEVINGSFFDYTAHMQPESVDLIVTSPPYLNNYHYNRNTRPQMYWLGFAHRPADFKLLEQQNLGKYWQTVREEETIDLAFHLPNSDLAEQIAHLRSLRADKGIYGGHGWANYAASYFNDCQRFVQGINYVLKPGRRALVVVGNSILQGVLIPTDQYLAQIAQLEGLELIQIDTPRATRVGNSIIQSDVRAEKAGKKVQLYEAVVELQKPR